MNRLWLAFCAMLVIVPFAAFAQNNNGGAAPAPFWGFQDTYQVTYFPNMITNDGVLNLVNSGAYTPPTTAINTGYLCANLYVFGSTTTSIGFDPSFEEMAACCTCPISRNGSRSVRAQQLLSNPLKTGAYPAVTVKVVWTRPANDNPANCAATVLPTANTLAQAPATVGPVAPEGGFATGGRCWSTAWHAPLPAPPNGIVTPPFGTGTQCLNAPLSANETSMLSNLCSIIWFSLGSGQGRCPVCPTGGTQGGSRTAI